MFLQKKEYTQLYRGAEKLMTAGLCKQIIWDQKIKIDYYMEHLPIPEGTKGRIRLLYLVRMDHKDGLLKKEAVCPLLFSKSETHYGLTQRERTGGQIIRIENCVIEFDGEYTVRLPGKLPAPGKLQTEDTVAGRRVEEPEKREAEAQRSLTEASQHMPEVLQPTPEASQSKTETLQPTAGAQQSMAKAPQPTAEVLQPKTVTPQPKPESPQPKPEASRQITEDASEKNAQAKKQAQAENPVRRIDDLKMLLEMGQQCVSLYYNSFLLHSFYQYRHVLLGDGFLGVPDYFYEREAIAAKMMGFSYFVEAKDIDNVSFEEGTPAGMPKDGAYGYFLCRLQSQ